MPNQLRMIYPKQLLDSYPRIELPGDYKLRGFREGDEKMYVELMRKAGFKDWSAERVQDISNNPLSPDGVYFIAFHGKLIAAACGLDRTPENGRDTGNLVGELGWIACNPAHRGRHLGKVVCAAAMNHLFSHNYYSIFFLTDDWRLAAIKTYLELGFEPVRNTAEMRWRWGKVSDKLEWKL